MLKQKNSFANIPISSRITPTLIETDRGKEFYNNNFQNSLKKIILNIIPEIHCWELFLQKGSIVLSEFFLKACF